MPDDRTPPEQLPSLPWTWEGGYPQRITGPDATLIAEVFESPDAAAVIAPTICAAVNAYFGWDGEATYPERLCTCDPQAYELGPEGQRRYFEDRYCPIHGEEAQDTPPAPDNPL